MELDRHVDTWDSGGMEGGLGLRYLSWRVARAYVCLTFHDQDFGIGSQHLFFLSFFFFLFFLI